MKKRKKRPPPRPKQGPTKAHRRNKNLKQQRSLSPSPFSARTPGPPLPPPAMDAGECSTSQPPRPSSAPGSSPASSSAAWANLGGVPAAPLPGFFLHGFLPLHGFLIPLLGSFPRVPAPAPLQCPPTPPTRRWRWPRTTPWSAPLSPRPPPPGRRSRGARSGATAGPRRPPRSGTSGTAPRARGLWFVPSVLVPARCWAPVL